jgi:hypothetical protein
MGSDCISPPLTADSVVGRTYVCGLLTKRPRRER